MSKLKKSNLNGQSTEVENIVSDSTLNVKINLHRLAEKISDERENLERLIQMYAFGRAALNEGKDWTPIDVESKNLNWDPRATDFVLKVWGLLNDKNEWRADLIDYGLVAPITYVEAAYEERVHVTLLSEKGRSFLKKFLFLTLA
jgi:hypothetical protein